MKVERFRYFARGAFIFALISAVSCTSPGPIVRRSGDTLQQGRSISPSAYAHYLRALHFEREGRLSLAEQSFRAALAEDRKSGASWAGLVRTSCTTRPQKVSAIARDGERSADRPALLLIAVANCLLGWSQKEGSEAGPLKNRESLLSRARFFADQALQLEPQLESVTESLKNVARAEGDPEKAERLTSAYQLYQGRSLVFHSDGNDVRLDAVDAALLESDLELARKLGVALLSPGELAVRAYAWSRPQLALIQAQYVVQSSPEDAHARLVLALLGEQTKSISFEESRPFDDFSDVALALLTLRLIQLDPAAGAHLKTELLSTLDRSDDALLTHLLKLLE